jgi:hypothetical protein
MVICQSGFIADMVVVKGLHKDQVIIAPKMCFTEKKVTPCNGRTKNATLFQSWIHCAELLDDSAEPAKKLHSVFVLAVFNLIFCFCLMLIFSTFIYRCGRERERTCPTFCSGLGEPLEYKYKGRLQLQQLLT